MVVVFRHEFTEDDLRQIEQWHWDRGKGKSDKATRKQVEAFIRVSIFQALEDAKEENEKSGEE